jgi:hypothetical protein
MEKEEGKEEGANKPFEPIDLSSLEDIDIEPEWVKKTSQAKYEKQDSGTKRERRRKSEFGGKKGPRKRFSRSPDRQKPANQFSFSIQPKGEVLQRIKDEMRKSGVSYGLSEICDTISGSPQRYNVIINSAAGEDAPHFVTTKIDDKIFSSKEKAVNHLLTNYSAKVFVREVEAEIDLSNNIQYAYQCPRTKALLPPNNYHYHEEVVRQHLLLNGISDTYRAYVKKLVKVDDSEEIALWAQKPLLVYRFAIIGNESLWYKSVEQLNAACMHEPSAVLFEINKSARISGDCLSLVERGIADQFNVFLRQRSNWLNGLFSACLINLKKSNFAIFKHSDKKRTFASAYRKAKIGDAPLNKISEKIVAVLGTVDEVKKIALLNHNDLREIDRKNLLIELKWLTKGGFVTEFSNGILVLN